MKNLFRTASVAACLVIALFHTAKALFPPAGASGTTTDPEIFLVQPAGTLCSGANATLEASLRKSYYNRYYLQLQKRAGGTEDWRPEGDIVNIGTSRTYTFAIPNAQPGFEYRVLAAHDREAINWPRLRQASAPLMLKVSSFTVSVTGTSTHTVCHGTPAMLHAAVSTAPGSDTVTGGYTYTWETSTDSIGWVVIPGQTGPTLLTDTLTASHYYRVTAAMNGCTGHGPSQAFKVTVHPAAQASAGPDQTRYNKGQFNMAAQLPDGASGRWSVVSGAADIADPASPATAVTIAPNASATLRWTITPDGPCLPHSDDVVITYTQQADLVILNTGPADRAAGQPITYRLAVINNGPSDASGVRIQDIVPAAITGFSYTPSVTGAASITGSSRNGDTVVLTGNLPAGGRDSIMLDITGTISPDAAAGTITNTATVTPPPGLAETMPATNTSRVNTNINTNVGLQLSKSGPALANAGSAITYTVEVTNTGTTNAIGVILLDNVPADVTNVTWTATAIGSGGTTVSKTGGTGNSINLTANIEGTTSGPGKIVLTVNGTVALNADTAITNIATLEYAGARQSSFTTAANRSADLRIRQAGPATAGAGAHIAYTLEVTNAGPADARGVVITDTVPAQISAVSWTASATGSATAHTSSGTGNIIALKADLPAGEENSIRVTVSGVTDPDYRGALTNTATAVPPPGNPDPTPASSSVVTQTALLYDLQVLQGGPAQVAAGQRVTYTITVTNNGPSNADGIRISDTVPASLQDVSWAAVASGNGTRLTGPASGSGRHILLRGRLQAGAGHQIVLTITGTVNPAFAGIISNTATVTAPDGTLASDSISTTVVSSQGLEIVKSGPSNVNAGGEILYAIAVTNHGPSDARAITISDLVPPQVQHVRWTATATGPGARITGDSSGTGNDILIHGDIAAGSSNRVYIIVTGRVDPSFTGIIHNTASARTGSRPPVTSAPVVTEVSRKSGLLISKNAPAAARANDSITYIVRVSNAGPSNAVNAVVTDQVPDGISNIRWTAAATGNARISSGAAGTGPAVAVTANIPPGAEDGVIITITGRIFPRYGGQLKNQASVTLPGGPPVSTDTCITTVQRTADIRVVKSGPGKVLPGGSLTYTIDVSNTGPGDADTVTVTDIVPAAIAVHDWSVTSVSGNSILYSPASGTGNEVRVQASLENGAQIRITINGAVLPDAAGLVHNMAQAVLPPGTIDPSPEDTSSVTTEVPFIAGPPSANLVLEKQLLSAAPYRIGQRVDYRITVRNEGPDTATGVQATDLFPPALGTPMPVLADKGQARFDAASRTLHWSIGTLPAGDRASLTCHVQLTGDGNVLTRAAVSGQETDPDTTTNEVVVSIPVGGDIFIPNVITPNGDGLNDRLVIPGLDKYPGSLLDIYNRWGNQVYHSGYYSNNWEGNGLAEGTYYYILQVKKPEGIKVYKGWVQLLR